MELADVIRKHESRLKAIGVFPLSRNRAQVLSRLTQNSSEWESQRLLLLGASELPMALGCSPYATPNQFLKRKWSNQSPTAAMMRGREQESTLAQLYVQKFKDTNNGVQPKLETTGIFAVPEAPFIAASPDRIQKSPQLALVELKSVAQLPDPGSIPEHFRYQVYTQLAATKNSIFKNSTPRAIIFVADSGHRHVKYEVEFTAEVEREWKESIFPRAVKFYLTNMLSRIEASVLGINELAALKERQLGSRPILPPPGRIQAVVEATPATPSVRVNKRVALTKTKKVGRVTKVFEAEQKAHVTWLDEDGNELPKQREKKIPFENLVVQPFEDEAGGVDRLGERCIITGGNRKDLVTATGKITSHGPIFCTVELDAGPSSGPNIVRIKKEFLRTLDGAREKTTPGNLLKTSVPLNELADWIKKYEASNCVKLIGDSTVENFVEKVLGKRQQQAEIALQESRKRRRMGVNKKK